MIFGRISFHGTRWYAVAARDPQMVRDQKKFGNHCCMVYLCLGWKDFVRFVMFSHVLHVGY